MIIAKNWKKYWIWITLAAIVLCGALLRGYDLGERPFVADEFLDINATYGYHQTGVWQAWDFNKEAPSVRQNTASDQRAWIYRVQVAKIFDFLPPVEWVARLTSVLWGIATIIIIYGVTYSWTRSPRVALIAAAIFAVSVPAIEINRTLRMYSMFAPIFLLLSWSMSQFFGRSLRGHKSRVSSIVASTLNFDYKYLLLVVPLFMLSIHLHLLTTNIVFVLLVFVCSMCAYSRLRGDKQAFSRYAIYSVLGGVLLLAGAIALTQYAGNIPQFLKLNNNAGYIEHMLRHFWHPILGALVIIWGVITSFARRDAHVVGRLWISVTALTILIFATMLWNRNVGAQYIFFLQPFIVILAAIGVDDLYTRFNAVFPAKKMSLGFALIVALLLPQYGYFFQENNTYSITAEGETPDYRKVFDYVKRQGVTGEALVTRNFRNYYYGGAQFIVTDFGSERSEEQLEREGKLVRVTAQKLREIHDAHDAGWFVFADNDKEFISKDAIEYARNNFQQITDSSLVRGKVFVYRWTVKE
jgi:hypothetical protein